MSREVGFAEGTQVAHTEQGAFVDGLDQAADRESGWGGLLEALAVAVA